MLEEVFNDNLIRLKKLMAAAYKKDDREMIGIIGKLSKELSLAYSDFKCQNPKCQSTENLQFHHLVMRKVKLFMDFWRYASARHYWNNIIILCVNCHLLIHQFTRTKLDETKAELTITQKTINKVKEKYFKAE